MIFNYLYRVTPEGYETDNPPARVHERIIGVMLLVAVFAILYLAAVFTHYPDGFDQLKEIINWWIP